MFQVLVDSAGNGCVLSHTDVSNNPITQNIVANLNSFKGWIPAKTNEKPESRTSFNLSIQIKSGILTGKIERVDQKAFMKSFDRPTSPEIYNKDYVYKNESLKNYDIQVWNSGNSNLPNNFDDDIMVDRDNIIWLTVDEGLVKFDGKKFTRAEQNITDKGKHFGYYAIACDNENRKWVCGGSNIYSNNDHKWTIYDSTKIGINSAYKIVNNVKSGEVFFCSDEGLTIYKAGQWSNLNKNKIKELPSNRVAFAKRDSKNRLWIGTFSGSVMIDENGIATSFNETPTVLKGKCIMSMDEDENGNVYFALYEFDRKDKSLVNNDEGIAICYANGDIKQFTTSNSGMPFNHVTKVLYDKSEKILWIATDRAGLVRFDLKSSWENYHNENSQMPTSYISDMAFDNNGILYLATRQGLVKVERRK
ncbi:ligand-binding sensor domain-containing protein [Mucilaginibacter gotjawali]|uniref:Ligand-binding sensor domain-containing protein n=2 Tax=Mucilaginibacter gotjawali TaxID=1550579 RepID=A0A839SDY7_9SPHI|nr:hypothetical protein [Mucilaginibacter gotjawali]MBB3055522.1 ligand-binding sensor domain-containing protein [Mucilaginibacter gotjawali]